MLHRLTCSLALFAAVAVAAPPTPAKAAPAPAAAPANEWAVAKATLTSGQTVVVNYRTAAPAKVKRADFAWRATVRCAYGDRGDGQGLPSVEVLAALQRFETKLAGPDVVRLMSKTGEGARETVFQAKGQNSFEEQVAIEAKEYLLVCTTTGAEDPKWSQWEETVKSLQAATKAAEAAAKAAEAATRDAGVK